MAPAAEGKTLRQQRYTLLRTIGSQAETYEARDDRRIGD
jgi:hypothetical protein